MINPDFSDLLSALNAAGVRYLLVGGYALAVHQAPRFTKDLDVWVEPTPENAERTLAALAAFGAPLSQVSAEDLARPGIVFQIGVPPNRIDILTAIDGVSFSDAWPNRLSIDWSSASVTVIGRADLIRNKRATGRPQDALDAGLLERDPH